MQNFFMVIYKMDNIILQNNCYKQNIVALPRQYLFEFTEWATSLSGLANIMKSFYIPVFGWTTTAAMYNMISTYHDPPFSIPKYDVHTKESIFITASCLSLREREIIIEFLLRMEKLIWILKYG